MKSIIYTHYGSPDVLQLEDLETPTPQGNEILIKIRAASVNALDWHLMRAKPFLARFANGLQRPKNTKLGADVAGVVEAVGPAVTQFQVGQAVFGGLPTGMLGAFAEYICVPETFLALKPAQISFEAAAAVPVAAFTALQGLRDAGHIQAGQQVLINGAAGGVGTFAVQIAKAYGAHVTAVCSTRNLEQTRRIGAEQVIDYTQVDFARQGRQYDLIFDAVGNRTVADFQRTLKPDGICVVAGFTRLSLLFQVIVVGGWVSAVGRQKIGLMQTAHPNQKDLLVIKDLLASGKVVPVVERSYPLAEVPEAIRYLETGHVRGKLVIAMP